MTPHICVSRVKGPQFPTDRQTAHVDNQPVFRLDGLGRDTLDQPGDVDPETEARRKGGKEHQVVRRRARRAGLPPTVNCHSFRATDITNYLSNGGVLEDARAIAAHESSQTTRLYDRTGDRITLDEIDRIRF